MKLPKPLTTVTPVSKLVALTLLVLLPLLGFWAGMTYQKDKEPVNTANRYYVGDTKECALIFFTCPQGFTNFTDEYGCGCERTSETNRQSLSTPELITQAFEKGKITSEQRLLYLTYAVSEYESLPKQFRGNVVWGGTPVLLDIDDAVSNPSIFCEMNLSTQNELIRLLPSVAECTTSPTTTNWKTYRNEEYGFEFEYPASYFSQEPTEDKLSSSRTYLATLASNSASKIEIIIDPTPFSLDYLKKYAPTGAEAFLPEKRMFNDTMTYYYGPGGGGVCYPDQYFLNVWQQLLILRFSGCENDKTPPESVKNLAAQIFSTFRFLDEENNPPPTNPPSACGQYGGTWLGAYNECENITQQQCAALGGRFDECASACRHVGNAQAVCIQLCIPVCSIY